MPGRLGSSSAVFGGPGNGGHGGEGGEGCLGKPDKQEQDQGAVWRPHWSHNCHLWRPRGSSPWRLSQACVYLSFGTVSTAQNEDIDGNLWTCHYTRLRRKQAISTLSHSAIKKEMLHQNHNPQYLLLPNYHIQEATPFGTRYEES